MSSLNSAVVQVIDKLSDGISQLVFMTLMLEESNADAPPQLASACETICNIVSGLVNMGRNLSQKNYKKFDVIAKDIDNASSVLEEAEQVLDKAVKNLINNKNAQRWKGLTSACRLMCINAAKLLQTICKADLRRIIFLNDSISKTIQFYSNMDNKFSKEAIRIISDLFAEVSNFSSLVEIRAKEAISPYLKKLLEKKLKDIRVKNKKVLDSTEEAFNSPNKEIADVFAQDVKDFKEIVNLTTELIIQNEIEIPDIESCFSNASNLDRPLRDGSSDQVLKVDDSNFQPSVQCTISKQKEDIGLLVAAIEKTRNLLNDTLFCIEKDVDFAMELANLDRSVEFLVFTFLKVFNEFLFKKNILVLEVINEISIAHKNFQNSANSKEMIPIQDCARELHENLKLLDMIIQIWDSDILDTAIACIEAINFVNMSVKEKYSIPFKSSVIQNLYEVNFNMNHLIFRKLKNVPESERFSVLELAAQMGSLVHNIAELCMNNNKEIYLLTREYKSKLQNLIKRIKNKLPISVEEEGIFSVFDTEKFDVPSSHCYLNHVLERTHKTKEIAFKLLGAFKHNRKSMTTEYLKKELTNSCEFFFDLFESNVKTHEHTKVLKNMEKSLKDTLHAYLESEDSKSALVAFTNFYTRLAKVADLFSSLVLLDTYAHNKDLTDKIALAESINDLNDLDSLAHELRASNMEFCRLSLDRSQYIHNEKLNIIEKSTLLNSYSKYLFQALESQKFEDIVNCVEVYQKSTRDLFELANTSFGEFSFSNSIPAPKNCLLTYYQLIKNQLNELNVYTSCSDFFNPSIFQSNKLDTNNYLKNFLVVLLKSAKENSSLSLQALKDKIVELHKLNSQILNADVENTPPLIQNTNYLVTDITKFYMNKIFKEACSEFDKKIDSILDLDTTSFKDVILNLETLDTDENNILLHLQDTFLVFSPPGVNETYNTFLSSFETAVNEFKFVVLSGEISKMDEHAKKLHVFNEKILEFSNDFDFAHLKVEPVSNNLETIFKDEYMEFSHMPSNCVMFNPLFYLFAQVINMVNKMSTDIYSSNSKEVYRFHTANLKYYTTNYLAIIENYRKELNVPYDARIPEIDFIHENLKQLTTSIFTFNEFTEISKEFKSHLLYLANLCSKALFSLYIRNAFKCTKSFSDNYSLKAKLLMYNYNAIISSFSLHYASYLNSPQLFTEIFKLLLKLDSSLDSVIISNIHINDHILNYNKYLHRLKLLVINKLSVLPFSYPDRSYSVMLSGFEDQNCQFFSEHAECAVLCLRLMISIYDSYWSDSKNIDLYLEDFKRYNSFLQDILAKKRQKLNSFFPRNANDWDITKFSSFLDFEKFFKYYKMKVFKHLLIVINDICNDKLGQLVHIVRKLSVVDEEKLSEVKSMAEDVIKFIMDGYSLSSHKISIVKQMIHLLNIFKVINSLSAKDNFGNVILEYSEKSKQILNSFANSSRRAKPQIYDEILLLSLLIENFINKILRISDSFNLVKKNRKILAGYITNMIELSYSESLRYASYRDSTISAIERIRFHMNELFKLIDKTLNIEKVKSALNAIKSRVIELARIAIFARTVSFLSRLMVSLRLLSDSISESISWSFLAVQKKDLIFQVAKLVRICIDRAKVTSHPAIISQIYTKTLEMDEIVSQFNENTEMNIVDGNVLLDELKFKAQNLAKLSLINIKVDEEKIKNIFDLKLSEDISTQAVNIRSAIDYFVNVCITEKLKLKKKYIYTIQRHAVHFIGLVTEQASFDQYPSLFIESENLVTDLCGFCLSHGKYESEKLKEVVFGLQSKVVELLNAFIQIRIRNVILNMNEAYESVLSSQSPPIHDNVNELNTAVIHYLRHVGRPRYIAKVLRMLKEIYLLNGELMRVVENGNGDNVRTLVESIIKKNLILYRTVDIPLHAILTLDGENHLIREYDSRISRLMTAIAVIIDDNAINSSSTAREVHMNDFIVAKNQLKIFQKIFSASKLSHELNDNIMQIETTIKDISSLLKFDQGEDVFLQTLKNYKSIREILLTLNLSFKYDGDALLTVSSIVDSDKTDFINSIFNKDKIQELCKKVVSMDDFLKFEPQIVENHHRIVQFKNVPFRYLDTEIGNKIIYDEKELTSVYENFVKLKNSNDIDTLKKFLIKYNESFTGLADTISNAINSTSTINIVNTVNIRIQYFGKMFNAIYRSIRSDNQLISMKNFKLAKELLYFTIESINDSKNPQLKLCKKRAFKDLVMYFVIALDSAINRRSDSDERYKLCVKEFNSLREMLLCSGSTVFEVSNNFELALVKNFKYCSPLMIKMEMIENLLQKMINMLLSSKTSQEISMEDELNHLKKLTGELESGLTESINRIDSMPNDTIDNLIVSAKVDNLIANAKGLLENLYDSFQKPFELDKIFKFVRGFKSHIAVLITNVMELITIYNGKELVKSIDEYVSNSSEGDASENEVEYKINLMINHTFDCAKKSSSINKKNIFENIFNVKKAFKSLRNAMVLNKKAEIEKGHRNLVNTVENFNAFSYSMLPLVESETLLHKYYDIKKFFKNYDYLTILVNERYEAHNMKNKFLKDVEWLSHVISFIKDFSSGYLTMQTSNFEKFADQAIKEFISDITLEFSIFWDLSHKTQETMSNFRSLMNELLSNKFKTQDAFKEQLRNLLDVVIEITQNYIIYFVKSLSNSLNEVINIMHSFSSESMVVIIQDIKNMTSILVDTLKDTAKLFNDIVYRREIILKTDDINSKFKFVEYYLMMDNKDMFAETLSELTLIVDRAVIYVKENLNHVAIEYKLSILLCDVPICINNPKLSKLVDLSLKVENSIYLLCSSFQKDEYLMGIYFNVLNINWEIFNRLMLDVDSNTTQKKMNISSIKKIDELLMADSNDKTYRIVHSYGNISEMGKFVVKVLYNATSWELRKISKDLEISINKFFILGRKFSNDDPFFNDVRSFIESVNERTRLFGGVSYQKEMAEMIELVNNNRQKLMIMNYHQKLESDDMSSIVRQYKESIIKLEMGSKISTNKFKANSLEYIMNNKKYNMIFACKRIKIIKANINGLLSEILEESELDESILKELQMERNNLLRTCISISVDLSLGDSEVILNIGKNIESTFKVLKHKIITGYKTKISKKKALLDDMMSTIMDKLMSYIYDTEGMKSTLVEEMVFDKGICISSTATDDSLSASKKKVKVMNLTESIERQILRVLEARNRLVEARKIPDSVYHVRMQDFYRQVDVLVGNVVDLSTKCPDSKLISNLKHGFLKFKQVISTDNKKIISNTKDFDTLINNLNSNVSNLKTQKEKINEIFLLGIKYENILKQLKNCDETACRILENNDDNVSKIMKKHSFNKARDNFIAEFERNMPQVFQSTKSTSFFDKFSKFNLESFKTQTELFDGMAKYRNYIKKLRGHLLMFNTRSGISNKGLSKSSKIGVDYRVNERIMRNKVFGKTVTVFMRKVIQNNDLKSLFYTIRENIFNINNLRDKKDLNVIYKSLKEHLQKFKTIFLQCSNGEKAPVLENAEKNIFCYLSIAIDYVSFPNEENRALVQFLGRKNYYVLGDLNLLISSCSLEEKINTLNNLIEQLVENFKNSQSIDFMVSSFGILVEDIANLLLIHAQRTKKLETSTQLINLSQVLLSCSKSLVMSAIKNNEALLKFSKKVQKILERIKNLSNSFIFYKISCIKRLIVNIVLSVKSNDIFEVRRAVADIFNNIKQLMEHLNTSTNFDSYVPYADALGCLVVNFCKNSLLDEFSLKQKVFVSKLAYELDYALQEFDDVINQNNLEYSTYNGYSHAIDEINFLNEKVNAIVDVEDNSVESDNGSIKIGHITSSMVGDIISNFHELINSYFSSNIHKLVYYNIISMQYLKYMESYIYNKKFSMENAKFLMENLGKSIQYLTKHLNKEVRVYNVNNNQMIVDQIKNLDFLMIEYNKRLVELVDRHGEVENSTYFSAITVLKNILLMIQNAFNLNNYERVMRDKAAYIKRIIGKIENCIVNKDYEDIQTLLYDFIDNSKEYFITAQNQYRSLSAQLIFHTAYFQKLLRFKNLCSSYIEFVKRNLNEESNIENFIDFNNEISNLVDVINTKSKVSDISFIQDICSFLNYIEFSVKIGNYDQAYEAANLLSSNVEKFLSVFMDAYSDQTTKIYCNIKELAQKLVLMIGDSENKNFYFRVIDLIDSTNQCLGTILRVCIYPASNSIVSLIEIASSSLENEETSKNAYNTILDEVYLFMLSNFSLNRQEIIKILMEIVQFVRLNKKDSAIFYKLNHLRTLLYLLKNELTINPISLVIYNIARITCEFQILKNRIPPNGNDLEYSVIDLIDICDKMNHLSNSLEALLLEKKVLELKDRKADSLSVEMDNLSMILQNLVVPPPSDKKYNFYCSIDQSIKNIEIGLQKPDTKENINKNTYGINHQKNELLSLAEDIAQTIKSYQSQDVENENETELSIYSSIQKSIVELSNNFDENSRKNLIKIGRDISQNLDKLSKCLSDLTTKISTKYLVEQDRVLRLALTLRNYSTQFKILCSVKAASTSDEFDADQSVLSFVELISNTISESIKTAKLARSLFIK